MRLRLLGLLLVAAVGAWLAASVSAASGEQPVVVKPAPKPVAASALRCPLPKRFRPAFERAARQTKLPLALLTAVARIESNLRRSAHELSLDADHPPSNVLAGARYLRLMLDRFHSTDLALAAYNAGPTAVARAGGAPSAEVLTYVADVTALWRRLHGCK
jgi:soluble lytic murein transglycosylase-like protein